MRIPDCEVKILFRPQSARRGFVVLCVRMYMSMNFVLVQLQHGDVSHNVKHPQCKARTSRCLAPSSR